MKKVNRRISSYLTAPRTWSTKACVKKLNKKWLLDLCEQNETRRTHRSPMAPCECAPLQPFAEASADALAVCPCAGIEPDLPPGSYQAGWRRREGPMVVWIPCDEIAIQADIYVILVYPHTPILTPTITPDRPLLGAWFLYRGYL